MGTIVHSSEITILTFSQSISREHLQNISRRILLFLYIYYSQYSHSIHYFDNLGRWRRSTTILLQGRDQVLLGKYILCQSQIPPASTSHRTLKPDSLKTLHTRRIQMDTRDVSNTFTYTHAADTQLAHRHTRERRDFEVLNAISSQ